MLTNYDHLESRDRSSVFTYKNKIVTKLRCIEKILKSLDLSRNQDRNKIKYWNENKWRLKVTDALGLQI